MTIVKNNFYQPSVTIEEFIQLHFSDVSISLYPNKLIMYENLLINEIASNFKINKLILKFIINNLNIDILNNSRITNQENYYLYFTIINTWYSSQTIKFSNKSLNYIKNFLSKKTLSIYRYDYEAASYYKHNQYFFFVQNYLSFHLCKINEFIHFINRNMNKIININKKLNKTINYISYLNQSDNKKIIDEFLCKRINSYEMNKIIIKYGPEIKELELPYNESIGKIFSRFDFKTIVYNIHGIKNNQNFIKDNTIRFIDYLSKFSKMEIKYVEQNNKILDLITDKKYDLIKIEEIIKDFKSIVNRIISNYYDINLYSHRQKIINDNFHHIRNLYHEINNICTSDSFPIINNLVMNKEKYINKQIVDFILQVATTPTHELIYI
jgi:hypothetical protein